MAYLYRRINTNTGLEECVSSIALKAYDEATFIVTAPGGVTQLSLAGYATLTLNGAVSVLRNGQDLNEGGGLDFVQNVNANRIDFNYVMPYGSLLKVRAYSEKPEEGVFLVTGDGGTTEFVLDGYVTLAGKDKIVVTRNGQDLVEGASSDFVRDIPNNTISFNYVVPKYSIVKVKAF